LGGDIKLEMSAEYRFNIYRFFKGALFIDAGNVWLHEANADIAGSPFLFSDFMNEIAVGTGFGIRIDVSFFLLRFDLAMPLRKPWLEENNRWVTDRISFGNKDWRRDNLGFECSHRISFLADPNSNSKFQIQRTTNLPINQSNN
jgi:outer membrane protein insertion porin family